MYAPSLMAPTFPSRKAGAQRGRGARGPEAVGDCSQTFLCICRWVMEKAREFQKNIYFCFIDYAKAFDSVDHNKL